MISRLVIVGAGLIILLILFVIVKNLLSSGNDNLPALINVVRQQQELVHIAKAASVSQQPISTNSRNVAVTTELSMTSARSQILSYAVKQHYKIDAKQIIYPGAKAIDLQLANASAASTFDSTYRLVLKNQLLSYQTSLKQAYAKTTGTKGRELLNRQYDGAGLLLHQLSSS